MIRTLFREQGITIASILMASGMAIGVLVEVLLPGGQGGEGKPPPKDETGVKEWVRNKLKALSLLLGRLRVKAAKALPGIIGAILNWILNKASDVVGCVSQNLWALVVGTRGLLYTYMVTKSKNYVTMCCYIIQRWKYHETPSIPVMLNVINANSLSCCSLLSV